MTKKDKSIIEANPGASPQDLLTLHGLSQSGFTELVAELEARGDQLQVSTNQKLKPSNILQPKEHMQPILGTQRPVIGNKVRVIPIGGGIGTVMSRTAGERLQRMNPKHYKLDYNNV